jgi:hypothetical protein
LDQNQTPSVLPKKCQFVAKTYQNFVFLGRKVQILDRLHIMVMFICFYRLKKSNFSSKSKCVTFGFTENASLRQKLTETSYFLVICSSSGSVTCNGRVYKFFTSFLRNSNFSSKSNGESSVLPKMQVCGTN